MKNLYLRIYATVVVVLLLFAAVSGWMFKNHLEQEHERAEAMLSERMSAWAELIQRSLPRIDAEPQDQAQALREWSQRLRLPLALDSAEGDRLAASESFERRQKESGARGLSVRLEDGRTLWIMRPNILRPPMPGSRPDEPPTLPFLPPGIPGGVGILIFLGVLFFAVAAGAFPVVRRLTRRLETLKHGVEQFGSGQLDHRVQVSGRDEVAAVAASFNVAASRIEALVRSHQSLLANASHELRSPLARMKMAVSMLDDASAPQRDRLKHEIDTNVAELDALVEEVLLASRLDAQQGLEHDEPVSLLALAAEEAVNVGASVDGPDLSVQGEERLLRRALRNLLENARRYGVRDIAVKIQRAGNQAELRVCDRGPGVPEALRQRIFEAFYRLPGHAEQAGGVGLGLSLVKQIAERHHGSVRCEANEGGGSCFVISLPLGASPAQTPSSALAPA